MSLYFKDFYAKNFLFTYQNNIRLRIFLSASIYWDLFFIMSTKTARKNNTEMIPAKINSILDILLSIFVIVSVVGLKDFQNRLQHIFGNFITLMSWIVDSLKTPIAQKSHFSASSFFGISKKFFQWRRQFITAHIGGTFFGPS